MRVIAYGRVEMCGWSGHNVRVVMECASTVICERVISYVPVEMCEWSGHNVRVNVKCASGVMCK